MDLPIDLSMAFGHVQDLATRHYILAPIMGGVLAHLVSHYTPPASLTAFASVLLLAPISLASLSGSQHFGWNLLRTTMVYLVTLGISISVYRLSPLHPLAQYPGPVLARVSRFWAIWTYLRGFQHYEYHNMFEKYGDVIRTGPNHLIIRNAEAIREIHGGKDRWPRHARAQVNVPYHSKGSVVSVIDPAEHSKRRRIWDRAFTPNAVKSYEPMLQTRLDQLIVEFNKRAGSPIDIAEWFGLFSIDFMGDFAFGGMFNNMIHGHDVQGLHASMVQSLHMIEIMGSVPWVRPIVQAIPNTKAKEIQQMGLSVARERKKLGNQIRDLFYYLLHEDEEHSTITMNPVDMGMEALLAIGAGSDTTATALANVIYYLIIHPAAFVRLRKELDKAAGENAPYDQAIDPEQLPKLKYLQAVIDETLRLMPAVPNGVQRAAHADRGPLPVAGHVIPPGTVAQIPTWSIHRDPRYFSPQPNAFWPERWLPDEGSKLAEARGEEFRLVQAAYMPFHYGPANCVGRSLALHEARTVLVVLIRRFEFSFAPGFTSQDWLDQLRDQFILVRGELKVVMTPRE